jgi:hypothetical protein
MNFEIASECHCCMTVQDGCRFVPVETDRSHYWELLCASCRSDQDVERAEDIEIIDHTLEEVTF